MNVCHEGHGRSRLSWRTTGWPLWGSLHAYVLPLCHLEADPGEELKLTSPYHLSSSLLPVALDRLTCRNSQGKAAAVWTVTGVCFGDTVLRHGPSHPSLWDPAEALPRAGWRQSWWGQGTGAVTGQCHPPGSTPAPGAEGTGGKGELKAPFALWYVQPWRDRLAAWSSAPSSHSNPATTNIQGSNCCRL